MQKDENTECNSISYNTTISALVGQKYCIDDANYLIIDAIDNQLCPCNADCFWEGEFILKMKVAATGKEYTYEFGSSERHQIYSHLMISKLDSFLLLPMNVMSIIRKTLW